MARIKWGGSLTSFIVIGVILVALVTTGAYFAQERGKQVRIDKATTIAEQQAKDAASQPTDNPASGPAPTPGTSTTSAPQASTTSSSSSATASTGQLPTTGMTFSLLQLLGVGFLTAVSVSYIVSRRNAVHSL